MAYLNKLAVISAKADIGLENVDNTSDANKPISTATQTKFDSILLSNLITKMVNKNNVKITFMGDSILEGMTSTTPGTDDCASLICSTLATRYGISVAKSNRAVGGRTVATFQVNGGLTSSLADVSDLYILAFGKNDIRSDYATPGTGYPLNASMGGLEYMIRRIRSDVPNASIILMSENPYSVANAFENGYLVSYNKKMRELASFYNIKYIDGYQEFAELGNWDSYLSDGSHPNSAGHAILANAILACFPLTADNNAVNIPIPPKSLYTTHRYDRRGWVEITTYPRTYGNNGFTFVGGVQWTGTIPYTSTTAGNMINCVFAGTECLLRLDCGAGFGVVQIQVDQNIVANALDLSTYSSGQRYIPITNLSIGTHIVSITVVSGTVAFRGLDVLSCPVEWFDPTSGVVTLNGASWQSETRTEMFNGVTRFNTAKTGISFSFSFVGTGCGVNVMSYPSEMVWNVAVDGGSAVTIDPNAPTGLVQLQYGRAVILCSNLPYGKHTIVVSEAPTNNRLMGIGTIFVFNENTLIDNRVIRGIAKVGDTVKYAVPFLSTPFLKLTGNAVYPTSETVNGFVVSGTAGEVCMWEAVGNQFAY